MADWAVWPIFIIELIIFFFLFFKKDVLLLDIRPRTWIHWLLVVVAVMIVVSLYHDSTEVLNLHF